jgi:hypothetical protein
LAKNVVGLNDNNALSMDYVVNEDGTKLIDVIYPIGSIYMSFNSTSPANLFGGTWTQITNRFLYCTTSSGTTGGENSHKLTVAEMPSHTHSWSIPIGGYSGWTSKSMTGYVLKWSGTTMYNTNAGTSTINTVNSSMNGGNGYTGSTSAHNNMPQYITCYAWYRTA